MSYEEAQPIVPIEIPLVNRNQRRREEWVKRRLKSVGASEWFELLNFPQYGKGCATALAYRKLGAEPDYPEERNESLLERGNLAEVLITPRYGEVTERNVRRPAMDEDGNPIPKYHPRYPWASVNADRIILAGSGGVETTGLLEMKSRAEGPWHRVQRQGPFYGDILQVQAGCWVTGYSWGSLVTLGIFGAMPLSYFDVKADVEMQEIFAREGDKFAEQVWGKNEVPAPTFPATDQRCRVCVYRLTCRGEEIDQAEAAVMRVVSKSAKDLVQITNTELAHTLSDIDLLKAEAKSIETSLDVARQKALGELGEVDAAWLHGYGKVYRMPTQANYFDAQRLKADDPTLYDKYMVHRLTGDHFIRTYPQK